MTPEEAAGCWYEAGPSGVTSPPGYDLAAEVARYRDYIRTTYGPRGVSQ